MVEHHPAGHCLRRGLEEFRGSASKEQEPGRTFGAICKDPEQREQIWAQLHFVDHDQSSEFPEHKARIAKPGLIVWIFQIEMV
jgi:hypothetical protein